MRILKHEKYERIEFWRKLDAFSAIKVAYTFPMTIFLAVYFLDEFIFSVNFQSVGLVLYVVVGTCLSIWVVGYVYFRKAKVEFAFVLTDTMVEFRDGTGGKISNLFPVQAIEDVSIIPIARTYHFNELQFRPSKLHVSVKYAGVWTKLPKTFSHAEAAYLIRRISKIAILDTDLKLQCASEKYTNICDVNFPEIEAGSVYFFKRNVAESSANDFHSIKYPRYRDNIGILKNLITIIFLSYLYTSTKEGDVFNEYIIFPIALIFLLELLQSFLKLIETTNTREALYFNYQCLRMISRNLLSNNIRSLDLKEISGVYVEVDNPSEVTSLLDVQRRDFSVVVDYGSNRIKVGSQYDCFEANYLVKRIRAHLSQVEVST